MSSVTSLASNPGFLRSIVAMAEEAQTLYVNNLNDKINRHELRRLLYHLFSSYGYVYDVVASRHGRMRGQAFIAFDSSSNALAAQQALQDFEVCGKPMRIAFARSKSDAVAKVDGSFQMKEVRKRAEKRRQERVEQIQQYFQAHKEA